MKEKEIKIKYQEFNSFAELEKEDKNLIEKAKVSVLKAYAPYSHFKVGAAVLLENGETVCSNNQENAAYPSGMCAERVAIYYASSKFPDVPVKAIAITANYNEKDYDKLISPCGNCRQALLEYEQKQGKPIKVILSAAEEKTVIINSIEDLLPLSFGSKNLE